MRKNKPNQAHIEILQSLKADEDDLSVEMKTLSLTQIHDRGGLTHVGKSLTTLSTWSSTSGLHFHTISLQLSLMLPCAPQTLSSLQHFMKSPVIVMRVKMINFTFCSRCLPGSFDSECTVSAG